MQTSNGVAMKGERSRKKNENEKVERKKNAKELRFFSLFFLEGKGIIFFFSRCSILYKRKVES